MSANETCSTSVLDNLLTIDQLAQRLGVSRRAVDSWRAKGTGPDFIRVGNRVLYRIEAVDAWLLSNEHRSSSEV